jgi:hypothetical protein
LKGTQQKSQSSGAEGSSIADECREPDSPSTGNGKPQRKKRATKDNIKVQHEDEASKRSKKTTGSTLQQPEKTIEDVQDLSGVRRNRTPSLKRKMMMEDSDAPAVAATPKKRVKISTGKKQDHATCGPATSAAAASPKKPVKMSTGEKQDQTSRGPARVTGSSSSRPKPRPKKAKTITSVAKS